MSTPANPADLQVQAPAAVPATPATPIAPATPAAAPAVPATPAPTQAPGSTEDAGDVRGRQVDEVVNGTFPPGTHRVVWRADAFPPGVYFVHLNVGGRTLQRKIIRVR